MSAVGMPRVICGYARVRVRGSVFRSKRIYFCVLVGTGIYLYRNESQSVRNPREPMDVYEIMEVASAASRKFGIPLSCTEQSTRKEKEIELEFDSEEHRKAWMTSITQQLAMFHSATSNPSLTLTPEIIQETFSIHSNRNVQSPPSSGPSSRGLGNRSGENNCFLNVIIQSLWHLESFRSLLLNTHIEEKDKKETSVVLALKNLLHEYQLSTQETLNPFNLRKRLSDLYRKDQKFQLGDMADAEETLLTILELLHNETMNSECLRDSNDTYDPDSISHAVFNFRLFSRTVCMACGAKSRSDLYNDLVFSTYVSEIRANNRTSIEQLLLSLPESVPERSCPVSDDTKCGGKAKTQFSLRRFPLVFAVSLIWVSTRAPPEDIQAVLSICRPTLNLAVLPLGDEAYRDAQAYGAIAHTYSFKGIVVYYGKHYFSFFATANGDWTLIDDMTVKNAGKWGDVAERIVKGRYQPVLLFFEMPSENQHSRAKDYVRSRASSILSRQNSHDPGQNVPPLILTPTFEPGNLTNYPSPGVASMTTKAVRSFAGYGKRADDSQDTLDDNTRKRMDELTARVVDQGRSVKYPLPNNDAPPSTQRGLPGELPSRGIALLSAALTDSGKARRSSVSSTDSLTNLVNKESLVDVGQRQAAAQQHGVIQPSIHVQHTPVEEPKYRNISTSINGKVNSEIAGHKVHNAFGVAQPERIQHSLPLPSKPVTSPISSIMRERTDSRSTTETYDVIIDNYDTIGIELGRTHDGRLYVIGFPRNPLTGACFQMERSQMVAVGDFLLSINQYPIGHFRIDGAIDVIRAQSRPLTMRWKRNVEIQEYISMFPSLEREFITKCYIQCQGHPDLVMERLAR